MDNDEELEIFLRARELFHSLPTSHKLIAIEAMEYMYSRSRRCPFAGRTQMCVGTSLLL